MRKALLCAVVFLHGFMFSIPGRAADDLPEQGLQLQIDLELSQDIPHLTEPQPVQNLQANPEPQTVQKMPAQPLPQSVQHEAVQAEPAQGKSFRTDYQLGQGWYSGIFYFSGYTNIEIVAPHGEPAEVNLDDLSLFVGGHLNERVNPFLEAEVTGHTLMQQGGGIRGNGYLVVERFYNDSMLTEHGTLRLGKILSPVGNWNSIHAAPLVSTNTRPMTTFHGFGDYSTGVSWIHDPEDGTTPDWQLYWQPGSEFPSRPKEIAPRRFQHILGAHVNLPLGLIDKVGASVQHGTLSETGETFTLLGLNINKSFGKLRVESEAIMSRWSGAAPRAYSAESGIYALVDYSITPHWHGILEAEHYQDHEVIQTSRNVLAGISYKSSPVVWKLEYVRQMGVSPYISGGWQASFSTLF